ncbi:MAG: sulfotransferase domain-containing protein [Verrucomicrobiales bacterium]|jgi:hypothetical protein|nr:sulfotransferase domain-containing protein [Verrucomicrobiales bacterium]
MGVVTKGIYVQGCARSGNTLTRELCSVSFQNAALVKLDQNNAECTLEHLVSLFQQSSNTIHVASRNYENSLCMDKDLLQANPHVKVLWMLRDPRDVLISIHSLKPGEYYVSPERWIKSLHLYQQFKNDAQVLTIRYEDIVQNPKDTQNKIAKFCNLAVSLQFEEAHNFFPKFHQNVTAMHSIRPIDTNSVRKWQKNPVFRDYLQQIFTSNPEIPELARTCGYDISLG